MEPKIKQSNFKPRRCAKCGQVLGESSFLRTKSLFFPDGYSPICGDCISEILKAHDYSWDIVDKFCQYMDIPFDPARFEEFKKTGTDKPFIPYAGLYFEESYEGINWSSYFQEFKKLEEDGLIREELPLLNDARRQELREKWGSNYDDEALNYLESLYNGLLMTQNISGALNGDQALKICKISYEIDLRIQAGEDFDKLLASYDKLIKAADFTPKNTKNASDFDSVGELFHWLEKRGFKNQFYDGVTRDVVDETIKNIQSWNQRLYTNESGIGEEITKRIESLKSAQELENYYDLNMSSAEEIDEYEVEGYDELMNNEDVFLPE